MLCAAAGLEGVTKLGALPVSEYLRDKISRCEERGNGYSWSSLQRFLVYCAAV